MFKVIIKDFNNQIHIVDGYFPTKRQAEEYIISIEGQYRDYAIVSRRKFESQMDIKRPFQLQYIKSPKKYDSFKPPIGMKRKK